MKQPTIKLGDPQPVECEHCGEKMGYQNAIYMKTLYISKYSPSGDGDRGFYTDHQPIINRCVRVECVNCGNKLKFKIADE